jgi:hypothetical protein
MEINDHIGIFCCGIFTGLWLGFFIGILLMALGFSCKRVEARDE